MNGSRKQSITYSPATGRIAESDGFRWDYLAGSNLKSKLTYPSGAMASWDYETKRDLLTKVTNAHADGTEISSYIYTNDFLGRRTSKNDEQYGYNARDELTSADEVSYNYDDIGNRTTAEGKTYTANNLNQYTAIDDFVPQYDDDGIHAPTSMSEVGNQTLIKTSTGIWSVTYNAENRPIRWQSGDTVITMSFDRMGRRVEMRTMKDGTETLQRFVYDNYLCIQQLRGTDNALFQSYVWNPTEELATRPLIVIPSNGEEAHYFHDGNKNVVDIVTVGSNNNTVAHYDYTPFGAVTVANPRIVQNPFRFSSEFYNDTLGLIYYNYRHYNFYSGRWITLDPIGDLGALNSYSYCHNASNYRNDSLGLKDCPNSLSQVEKCKCDLENIKEMKGYSEIIRKYNRWGCTVPSIKCQCCHQYGVAGYYEKRKYFFWGNKITLCADTPNSSLENTVYHELIHGLQSCKKRKDIKGGCSTSICSEIGAYYNSTCRSHGDPEQRRACVLKGVKRSSKSACNGDNSLMEKEFKNLYESCTEKERFGILLE